MEISDKSWVVTLILAIFLPVHRFLCRKNRNRHIVSYYIRQIGYMVHCGHRNDHTRQIY